MSSGLTILLFVSSIGRCPVSTWKVLGAFRSSSKILQSKSFRFPLQVFVQSFVQKYYAEVGLCLTRDEKGVEFKLNCLNSTARFCCKKTSGQRSLKFCCDYETYLNNALVNFFAISFYFTTFLILTLILIVIHLFSLLKAGDHLDVGF